MDIAAAGVLRYAAFVSPPGRGGEHWPPFAPFFRVIVLILVVPAIVSIASLLSNNMRYNAIIAHMGRVGDLKPKVAVDIPEEA